MTPHPAEGYYFKLTDLSINLSITLKWAAWGYFFLKCISISIQEANKSELCIKNYIPKEITLNDIPYTKHVLFIDDIELKLDEDFVNTMNDEYVEDVYQANTRVRLKLKINLADFLLLQNILLPTIYTK